MGKVLRYPIETMIGQRLLMKPGPIIHVGLDPSGTPCIWILATTETDIERTIFICQTGGVVPANSEKHIGSFMQGSSVWHVFEVI